MNRLLVSFSGGETSAYMTLLILAEWREWYDEILVVFANTGQEHENTLRFVKRCDDELGFGSVWLEAVVHEGTRRAPTHRIVDFETADRSGAVFEASIRKYGIPTTKFPHCTRSLKLNPIKSYAKSIGWDVYDTAIGIRNDEIDRMSMHARANRIVYPLISVWPTTKPEINDFWKAQPFRLELHAWQGNCKWCWKKSFRKHFTNLHDNPEWYDFPQRMEELYPRIGPEFSKDSTAADRVFFRGSKSTAELRAMAAAAPYDPPSDSNAFNPDLDVGAGCEESCEVYGDENLSVLTIDTNPEEDIFA